MFSITLLITPNNFEYAVAYMYTKRKGVYLQSSQGLHMQYSRSSGSSQNIA